MRYNFKLNNITLIAITCFAVQANARPLPDQKAAYLVRIYEQDLTEVLKQFGKNIGVVSEVSADIEGVVIDYHLTHNRCKFVVELGKKFGFDYYFDGKKVHFFKEYEKVNETIQLKGRPARFMISKLKKFDIWEKRFTQKSYLGHKLLNIYGPKAYLDDLKHHIKLIEQGDPKPFHQFRGKIGETEPAEISPALSFESH